MRCLGLLVGIVLLNGCSSDDTTAAPAPLDPRVEVSAGHACQLLVDGSVVCWGDGAGAGSGLNAAPVAGLAGVVQIGVGADFACVRLDGGTVSCWGRNQAGQLGLGSNTDTPAPTPVPGLEGVADLRVGKRDDACAILESGSVKCWGNDGYGQLGDGDVGVYTSPLAVPKVTGVAQLSLGETHSCAVHPDGTVSCWGNNQSKQTGADDPSSTFEPTTVAGVSQVTEVAAGQYHTCALREDGGVTCWGDLATPTKLGAASQIGSGADFSCALVDADVFCWGSNFYGTLGNGDMSMGASVSAVKVTGLGAATSIAVGLFEACAIVDDGSTWCWGQNASGEVGDGTRAVRYAPVKVKGL